MSDEPQVTHVPVSAWTVLPPAPDACQVCGRDHRPEEPHDANSLYWATTRTVAGEPAPTWTEALAHVPSGSYRDLWVARLAEHGIEVPRHPSLMSAEHAIPLAGADQAKDDWALVVVEADTRADKFRTLGGAAWPTERARDAAFAAIPELTGDTGAPRDWIVDVLSADGHTIVADRRISEQTALELLGVDDLAPLRAAFDAGEDSA